jgi:hypothetical protein
MNEKTFKQYKNIRRNLRALGWMMILSALNSLSKLGADTPTISLVLMAASAVAAIGLITWQSWGRHLALGIFGINFLVVMPLLPSIPVPATLMWVLFTLLFSHILLDPKGKEVNRYRGDLDALRLSFEAEDVFA